MKKALALVLALVLALSMAVSAFALDVVTLTKVNSATATKTEIPVIDWKNNVVYTNEYFGDTYYVALDPTKNYTDIKLNSNGNVTASLVEFNPETMEITGMDVTYTVYELVKGVKTALNGTCVIADPSSDGSIKGDICVYRHYADNNKTGEDWQYVTYDNDGNKTGIINVTKAAAEAHTSCNGVATAVSKNRDYEDAKNIVNALNNATKSGRFVWACDQYVNIIKLVVEDNFSAAYTSGTVAIDAIEVAADGKTKTAVEGDLTVICDVNIFEYEMVKWASKGHDDTNAKYLEVEVDEGYSDYLIAAADGKYSNTDAYNSNTLRNEGAAVVCTTAFRAIAGQDLYVVAGDITVDIEKVAAGQKGVNFLYYGSDEVNAEGYTLDAWKAIGKKESTWEIAAIDFGFYGDQKINSNFTVTAELPYTWFTLREIFGERVEEDDIITYYVLKDGKVAKEYKVDYMTIGDKLYDAVEIELELSNTTLGQYEIVLEVPSAEVAGESNPNTGAESVVGVVAALAVVSLASAAAVSLKK